MMSTQSVAQAGSKGSTVAGSGQRWRILSGSPALLLWRSSYPPRQAMGRTFKTAHAVAEMSCLLPIAEAALADCSLCMLCRFLVLFSFPAPACNFASSSEQAAHRLQSIALLQSSCDVQCKAKSCGERVKGCQLREIYGKMRASQSRGSEGNVTRTHVTPYYVRRKRTIS